MLVFYTFTIKSALLKFCLIFWVHCVKEYFIFLNYEENLRQVTPEKSLKPAKCRSRLIYATSYKLWSRRPKFNHFFTRFQMWIIELNKTKLYKFRVSLPMSATKGLCYYHQRYKQKHSVVGNHFFLSFVSQ